MQCRTVVCLSLLSLGALVASAHAQTEMTRQQVKAELAKALRMGDLPVSDGGQSAREINPSAYPARPVVVGKTRAQVEAELAEAMRMGEIPISDSGLRPRDLHPSLYPTEGK